MIVLSSLTLLALGNTLNGVRGRTRDSLRPVGAIGNAITEPVESAVGSKLSYKQLKDENAKLRRELDAAKADANRYADAVRERSQLLRLQKFSDPAGYKSVSARIVSLVGDNFMDRVELDVGSSSGVRIGSPVVTESGLVGKVTAVSSGYSTVTLITDPQSNVGVRLSESGEVGIARGDKVGSPMRVDLLAVDAKTKVGEVLVTSGLQRSAFPPGIPVGKVRSVRVGSIQLEVTLDPVVDLGQLTFVKVLLPGGAA